MTLFAGTAEFYRRFRAGVPVGVVDALLTHVEAPKGRRRLLDLGTGTGLVVRALWDHFDDIIAVDPDADLLDAARRDLPARRPHGPRLRLVLSTAESFAAPSGWTADLVTVCRAFHWMDQPRVLRRLDSCVSPDGAVAVFGDGSFWTSGTPWKVALRELVQEFLGPDRRAGSGLFTHHERPYREIFAESPFSVVAEQTIVVVTERTVESAIGYLHSTSFASPRLFGGRLVEFDDAARTLLAAFSLNGTLVDDNEFHVLVAHRPGVEVQRS